MSVRKIRSDAQFVDLGRPEESPLDKLNKLVSGVGNIMSGVSAIREKRSTEQINSIQMLNNVIDRADDLEDLKNIQNRISSLPYNYHNDAVNIASEALQLKYKQADEDFEYMQGLGDEIANFTTKPLSFTDSKGNNIEKTFSELSVEEIIDYSKSFAGTNELKSGLLGNITENMNKIKQLKDAFGRQFGEKRKNPRFKFKNHLGADVNISEFATISKRYADQMEIFIDAGLGPSDYLNYEEAQLVKNGDVAGYEEKKKQRETEFASYIPRVRKEIDSIGKMILDLRGVGDDDELSAEFIASLGNVLKLTDAKGNPFAAELALQQNGVNAPLDVNNMYEDIVGDFTKMSTNGIVDYLGKVKKELEDEEDLNVKAAISWGFGARFGYANVEPDKDALKGLIEESKEIKKEKELLSGFTEEMPKDVDTGQTDAPTTSGNISQIAQIMKKYEAVPKDSTLTSLNNLYAIKYGNRASKYGAVDSGVDASDGGTWAQWPDKESMEAGSQKIIEEMFLNDAKGDVTTFVKNYIGKKDINDPEVQSRVAEIQNISSTVDKNSTEAPLEDTRPSLTYNILNTFGVDTKKQIKLSESAVNSLKSIYEDEMKNTKNKLKNLKKRKVTSNYPWTRKMDDISKLENKIKNIDFVTWWQSLPSRIQKKYALKFSNKEQRDFIKYYSSVEKGSPQYIPPLPGSEKYGTPDKIFYDELRPNNPLLDK